MQIAWDGTFFCLLNVHNFLSLHSPTELPLKACWTWRSSDQLSWSQGVETLTNRITVTVQLVMRSYQQLNGYHMVTWSINQLGYHNAPKAMWATCRAFPQAVGPIIPWPCQEAQFWERNCPPRQMPQRSEWQSSPTKRLTNCMYMTTKGESPVGLKVYHGPQTFWPPNFRSIGDKKMEHLCWVLLNVDYEGP